MSPIDAGSTMDRLSSFAKEHAPVDPVGGFLEDLTAQGVSYAILRRLTRTVSFEGPFAHRPERSDAVEVLVAPKDLAGLREVARRHGLEPTRRADGAIDYRRYDTGRHVRVATELRYGNRVACLETREPLARILRRAENVGGVRIAAPSDRLVDSVLHCLLDLRSFPEPRRRELSALVSELRADPPAAGRAAERVQQELAPALQWGELLADLVQERWDGLLARGAGLRLQLWRRSPVASTARWVRGTVGSARATRRTGAARRNGRARTAGESGAAAPDVTEAYAPTTHGVTSNEANPNDEEGDEPVIGREHIRGSGLLLSGRGLSVGLKFLAELMIVRYLATSDYGAWTYALSAIAFLRVFATLGMNRAIVRFLPIHLERNEVERFFGVTAFAAGTLLLASAVVISVFYAFPGFVAGLTGATPDQPLEVLFILIFLMPIDMIDDLMTGICAALTESRTIFVRRYLLSPGLRIGVAGLLVLLEADVSLLAYGYLVAGIVGIGYYAVSVYFELRRRGLIDRSVGAGLTLPVRDVLRYTVPVMAADWCGILMTTAGPLLLGYFSDMSAVAMYQVVVPMVVLTKVVHQSFGVLFEPEASRLHSRGDRAELGSVYWRTATWVAVLSFIAFAIPFAGAKPLTVFLYGERYAESASVLSILTLGMFFDASLGLNAATVRVAGKVRWLVAVNVVAAASIVGLNILLIPRFGILGAAIGTGLAWILYGVLKQAVLCLTVGVPAFDTTYSAPYLAIISATAGLAVVRLLRSDALVWLVPAVTLAVLFVVMTARRSLSIGATFPELARVPVLGAILR